MRRPRIPPLEHAIRRSLTHDYREPRTGRNRQSRSWRRVSRVPRRECIEVAGCTHARRATLCFER